MGRSSPSDWSSTRPEGSEVRALSTCPSRPPSMKTPRRRPPPRKPMFDQKGCVFEPHVMGLMTGVPVTLKSSDPANHNVNVKLKNSTFNSDGRRRTVVPVYPVCAERTPGQVVCDIHPWMSSWWMVLDSPYFAVTDDKGYFEIKNVPAGTQKVVVWQEAVARGFVTPSSGEDITIKANDTTVKRFHDRSHQGAAR